MIPHMYEKKSNTSLGLSLIFDQNMKWQLHINNIMIMRLCTIIYKIYCLRKIISSDTVRIVYSSLYQTIFEYGIMAWSGTYENAIKPLTIQQN